MLTENKNPAFVEFETWLNGSFLKRNGGYFPPFREHWFNKVDKAHEKLRGLLGGPSVQRFYKLESQQRPLEKSETEAIVKEIKEILPGYFEAYGFDEDCFRLPTLPQGNHNGIKITKHINNYASDALYYNPEAKKKLAKLLSQLGELWGRARTSACELEVTLSTTHKGFTLLGHYGPDQESCWRQGTTTNSFTDKYIIAQTPNTFVITISKFNDKKKKQMNVARCFGFASEDLNTFNLSNYYFVPGFTEGDGLQVIRMLFEELWKDVSEIHERKASISGKVFHNEYGNFSFTKGKGSFCKSHVMMCDQQYILDFRCQKCGHRSESRRSDGWSDIDGTICCSMCCESAYVCDLSGKMTFKELVPFVGEHGNTIYIHPDIADLYKKCSRCSVAHAETNVMEDGSEICSDCIETYFADCEICEETVKDSDLVLIGTLEICPKCISTGRVLELIRQELEEQNEDDNEPVESGADLV